MDRFTDLEDKAAETASTRQHDGNQTAEDLQSRAKEAWNSAQDQAQRAVRESSEYIRENRWPALAGAFVFGLLVGRLLGRRHSDSFSDRYVSEPVNRSRDLLLSLPIAAAATMFTRFGRSAAGSVNSAVGSVKKAVHR